LDAEIACGPRWRNSAGGHFARRLVSDIKERVRRGPRRSIHLRVVSRMTASIELAAARAFVGDSKTAVKMMWLMPT